MILEDKMPEKQIKVKVLAPYRVCHEGEAFTDGDTVSVPEKRAQEWEDAGWVKPVTSTSTKK
jgi:hypothetical protein